MNVEPSGWVTGSTTLPFSTVVGGMKRSSIDGPAVGGVVGGTRAHAGHWSPSARALALCCNNPSTPVATTTTKAVVAHCNAIAELAGAQMTRCMVTPSRSRLPGIGASGSRRAPKSKPLTARLPTTCATPRARVTRGSSPFLPSIRVSARPRLRGDPRGTAGRRLRVASVTAPRMRAAGRRCASSSGTSCVGTPPVRCCRRTRSIARLPATRTTHGSA